MLRRTFELAEEWLTWPERWEHAAKAVDCDYITEKKCGLLSNGFQDYVMSRHRDMKQDDVAATIRAFVGEITKASAAGSVVAWLYEKVLETNTLHIAFDGPSPQIAGSPKAFEAWCSLLDQFDPDNFVALALARGMLDKRIPIDIERVYAEWPLVLPVADKDMQRLAGRGLSDLHLHFKSLWPVPLSWQRVVRRESRLGEGLVFHESVPVGRADAYKPVKDHERGFRAPADIEIERGRVKEGAGLLSDGSLLRCYRSAERSFLTWRQPNDTRDVVPRRVRDVLSAERAMLVGAWYDVLRRGDCHKKLEAELDRYLLAKSLFRARHLQSFKQSNPGLVAFDVSRKRNSHLGRLAREETAGGGFSGRRFRNNNAMLLSALLDCRHLVRAELRIAPPDATPSRLGGMYARLMRASQDLLDDIRGSESFARTPEPSLRFAVHFKRFLPEERQDDRHRKAPPSSIYLRKLMEYDRETAALQSYRFRAMRRQQSADGGVERRDPSRGSKLIGRVDLASPERGSGPWLIAPYIRLLRGDPAALAKLEQHSANPYLARWHSLVKLGQASGGLAERLGITCHAGEDFYTLVDGLWHIDAAIENWGLSAGDGIGHVLALGLRPEKFKSARLPSVRMRKGVQLDSLVWLFDLLFKHTDRVGRIHRELESFISSEATACYGAIFLRQFGYPLSIDTLLGKCAEMGEPVPACSELAVHRLPASAPDRLLASLSPGGYLRYLDYFDHKVASWRNQLVPPDRIQSQIDDLLLEAQDIVLTKLRTSGIVIETNPSSNLRMELATRAADLPIFDIIDRGSVSPRVTVCTDNPGTYDTNVATEFSLMFSGLLDRLGPDRRDEALRRLDQLRRHGLEDVNWQD